VLLGLSVAAIGGLLMLAERLGLGKLPGDLVWKRRGFEIRFPIVTSLILSVVLTVLLNLLLRRK